MSQTSQSIYTSTAYGILPIAAWNAYRAAILRHDAKEWHDSAKMADRKPSDDRLTDIKPGAF